MENAKVPVIFVYSAEIYTTAGTFHLTRRADFYPNTSQDDGTPEDDITAFTSAPALDRFIRRSLVNYDQIITAGRGEDSRGHDLVCVPTIKPPICLLSDNIITSAHEIANIIHDLKTTVGDDGRPIVPDAKFISFGETFGFPCETWRVIGKDWPNDNTFGLTLRADTILGVNVTDATYAVTV